MIDRQRVEGITKSGRSRVVSLDPSTVRALKAHRARQDEERLRLGESWKGGGAYVFTTGWGDPLFPDTPSSLMPKLIETHNKQNPRAQLPHARLHDLRHIHATTLLLAGVPVHVVAARLGHADPAITLRVYAHVIHEQAATAADVFAAALETQRRVEHLQLSEPCSIVTAHGNHDATRAKTLLAEVRLRALLLLRYQARTTRA
ncbi:Phage integrase family protein [Nonomuraea solani]|uniref:Phage integrase family protein n=1 Tax=Nonomuraea solani TaxID=1144553 RepID=A0A1H6ETU1_9ACTN|nr:Phage integrase family protein [Nonomuraea solani]